MHPLDGAYERVNGAREHLDNLRPEIDAFAKVIAGDISLKYQKGMITLNGRQVEVPIGSASAPFNVPTPPKVSRIIGDVINNLRSALDYLVYELACFDSKSIIEKTQFVIVDSEENFKKQLWHLNGLTGEHKAMFERLQPYKGCKWTELLRDISNPDKHKHLTIVRNSVNFRIDSKNTEAILSGQHVDTDKYASIQVAFENGLLVIDSLDQLVLDVAETLRLFHPQFQ